jgi:hypothetical protein
MSARETGQLKVLSDFNFPETRIVINPNDGFDIGLMMTEAEVKLCFETSVELAEKTDNNSQDGVVFQKNECNPGTVQLSSRALEKIGSPRNVRLHLVPSTPQPRLIISPA